MLEVAEEETLHNNFELHVYSRKKFHQTTRENPTILEGQASTPSNTQSPCISYSIPIVDMTLISPLFLEKELEHVLNTLLQTFYPIINYLKSIRPLFLKSLINLYQEMFRRLLVTQIGGQQNFRRDECLEKK